MRVFLCVCFTAAFILTANGQTTADMLCSNIPDFTECNGDWNCNVNISRCFCNSGQPYCRCNNFKDEFYLGENCSQKWNTLTFALVATLPGVTLALLVGVIVHLIHISRKSSSGKKMTGSSAAQQDMFTGMVFSSDVNAPPSSPAAGVRPQQSGVPMTSVNPRPYSMQENSRPPPDRQQMGGLQRTYSQHENSYSSGPGGPRPPYSPGNLQPSSSKPAGQFGRPALGGPAQPYSYTAAPGQVLSNPYAKSRNPYEERSPSPDHYSRALPPHTQDHTRAAPYSSPSYGAPDYSSNNRSAFPRAQINRNY